MKPLAQRGLSTALTFGAATSDRVNVGTSATLENHTAASYLAWVYTTTDTNSRRIYQKGLFAGNGARALSIGAATPELSLQVNRATTILSAAANLSNFAAYALNSWVCFAGVHDTGGANGDQKLYCGNLLAPLAEPSAYSAQSVGSGAPASNAGSSAFIANTSNTNAAFQGRIALVAVFNRVLSLAELRDLQYRPRPTRGCVGFWQLGRTGTSTQMDYSGNGNHGTVTGATFSHGPPIRPVRRRKFAASVAAPAGGNRRRRVIIGSAA
jgi:hypothetical protein